MVVVMAGDPSADFRMSHLLRVVTAGKRCAQHQCLPIRFDVQCFISHCLSAPDIPLWAAFRSRKFRDQHMLFWNTRVFTTARVHVSRDRVRTDEGEKRNQFELEADLTRVKSRKR